MSYTEKNAFRANNSSRKSTQTERNTAVTLFNEGLGTQEQAYLFIISLGLREEFHEFCQITPNAIAHQASISVLYAQAVAREMNENQRV